jgi:hypothetical protein
MSGTPTERERLMPLIDLEYDRTAKFIDGVTATAATIRGWAVTVWLALLGVAFDHSVWELGALAAILAAVFLVMDGYHAWLYGEAMLRVTALERLEGANYDVLGRRAGDPDAEADLRIELEGHRFGLYRNFTRFRFRDLRYVRPYVFFRVFYPFLAVVGISTALYIHSESGAPAPVCTAVRGGHSQVLQCGSVMLVVESAAGHRHR